MAAIPAPVVIDDTGRTEDQIDHEKLQHCLFHIVKIFGENGNVDPASVTAPMFFGNTVIQALHFEECELFSELLSLGPDDIKNLNVSPYRLAGVGPGGHLFPAVPLHGKWTRRIRCLVAYYCWANDRIES